MTQASVDEDNCTQRGRRWRKKTPMEPRKVSTGPFSDNSCCSLVVCALVSVCAVCPWLVLGRLGRGGVTDG